MHAKLNYASGRNFMSAAQSATIMARTLGGCCHQSSVLTGFSNPSSVRFFHAMTKVWVTTLGLLCLRCASGQAMDRGLRLSRQEGVSQYTLSSSTQNMNWEQHLRQPTRHLLGIQVIQQEGGWGKKPIAAQSTY